MEHLRRDGGEAVAVEPEDLQAAGEVGEGAGLQRRDAVVVEEPERGRVGQEAFSFCAAPGRGRGHHSQVLERQHGEGAGLDLHDVVVAEVERLQGDEGPQPLGGDPGDPVVGSENTDADAPVKQDKASCDSKRRHGNSRFPHLARGIPPPPTHTQRQTLTRW